MSLKQLAINTGVVLGIVTLAFLLYAFRDAVIVFIFSLAIAAAARPFVDILASRGVSNALAVVLVYALFAIFIGLIFWAVGSSLLYETRLLTNNLAVTYENIWSTWPKGTQFQQLVVQQLPPPNQLYQVLTPAKAGAAMNSLLGFTLSSAAVIAEVFTVLVLSIYWGIDRVHFERLWISLIPAKSRATYRDMWRAIERDFGSYVRSQILQSIFAGALLGFGLWGMGIQYPTLLAVFAALAWLIPWLGGVLVVLPIALTGFTQSLGLGIFATIYTIGVLFLLNFLIEPRFTHRRQFSSLLSILLIIALIAPFGLIGFIIAPPLAAAIELVFRYNLQSRPIPETIKSDEQITQLRARILNIRDTIARSGEPPEPQTLSMLTRLEELVNRSDQVLETVEKPRKLSRRLRV